MYSMAESFFKLGMTDEFFVSVILAPDTMMMLFIDGSSIVESLRSFAIYESCWT